MATLKGSYPFSINQSETGRTIFGLPGQGTGNSTYLNVDLDGTMKVYDDGTVRMDVSGRIWHDLLLSNDYPVILVVCPHDWNWTWNSDDANVPSGGHVISRAIVNVPQTTNADGRWRGDFEWNINVSNVDLGDLEDYAASRQGTDGAAWFSGTGDYYVNDPIAPDPMKITIPGFLEYLDYYPFAVYAGGSWKSANRDGGDTKVYVGSSWRDVKNVEAGTGTDQGQWYNGSSWQKAPKIGKGA